MTKPKPVKIARQHNIHAKIASQGYCCIYGYLKLAQKERTKPPELMAPLGFSRITFYHHLRKLKDGKYTCAKRPGCVKPCLRENDPAPTHDGVCHRLSEDLGSDKGGA